MPDDVPKIPRHRGCKNKPRNTAWQQQRLPALRPYPTAGTTAPIFIVLGGIVVALGIAQFFGNVDSFETTLDYTGCTILNGSRAKDLLAEHLTQGPLQCELQFDIEKDYFGDVNFYYGLSKFYQNNRLYFNSRNDQQYYGKLNKNRNDQLVRVPFTTRNVIRERQAKRKYKNPKLAENQTLCEAFQNTTKPPSWRIPICELGASTSNNSSGPEYTGVGFENVDFMVWMTAAALPKFRKMYRKLDRQSDDFAPGLPAGNYTLKIVYNYPVDSFNGSKYFVITRESWTGERNFFLPILYFVVGGIMLIVGFILVLFWLREKLSRRTLHD